MRNFNIVIIGCGNVGGGTAKIIYDTSVELAKRAGNRQLKIERIITRHPQAAAKKYGLPIDLFCADADVLSNEDCEKYIQQSLQNPTVELIIETVGGSSVYIHDLHKRILKNGKHLVTANKAILAKHGYDIFEYAKNEQKAVGYEASVCGAIPLIKVVQDSFTGDIINTVSGIVNGTSNFVLSRMSNQGESFEEALQLAQRLGYAELNPELDINGMDAANKLKILVQLIYGIEARTQNFAVKGITTVWKEDFMVAKSIRSTVKQIAFATKQGNEVFAYVRPAIVPDSDFLHNISGATNAIKLNALYSGEHIFVGQGAGALETGSAVVSDVVFIAKHGFMKDFLAPVSPVQYKMANFSDYLSSYLLIIKTTDQPGVIGTVGTALGDTDINIENIAQSIISGPDWFLPVEVSKCSENKLQKAISLIRERKPLLIKDYKFLPIIG
ncbi:MAG: homoserine dehydrogenase [Prevotellaceae bacterium]|jgi:homoserine dehydrogenase|nr:homoserine dehydrogenase [Prevotellaceae bacterium]